MGHNVEFVANLFRQGELDRNSSFVIGVHWSARFSFVDIRDGCLRKLTSAWALRQDDPPAPNQPRWGLGEEPALPVGS